MIQSAVAMKRIIQRKTVLDAPITSIGLDLTNDCTLKCDYCFRGEKNKQKLSWQVGTKAIDLLIRYSQSQKSLKVSLFGGEPLMEFGLIKKLVPYAEQKVAYYGKKIHFTATTNCVLVNDEIIRFFRRHQMKFHTSIDGSPESNDRHRRFPDGRGTSAIIEPKIKKILEYWPDTVARGTLSNDIVHRWMDDTVYLVNLGYKNIAVLPIAECNWTEQQWRCMRGQLRMISNFYIERFRAAKPIYFEPIDHALRSIAKPSRPKTHCGAGAAYVAIKTDGTIYPCSGFDPRSTFGGAADANWAKKWRLGSVFGGIDQEKRKIFLNLDSVSQTKADCENCLAVHMCGNPCIAVNWSCLRDIYKPHPNQCRFYNMYFREALRIHYILESQKNVLFMRRLHSRNGARQKFL
jgi:uncharacterized protein